MAPNAGHNIAPPPLSFLVISFLRFLFSRASTQTLTFCLLNTCHKAHPHLPNKNDDKHPPLCSSCCFLFHDVVSKHTFVMSGTLTQKAKAKPREMGGKSFPAVPLTNLSSVLRLCVSHASRVAATSKVSFTMNTEGDVFYVYVKRQFVSTVISADECL